MLLFLVGAVCFLAALRVARDVAGGGGSSTVRGGGAAAWLSLLAVLTLAQLWLGREALQGYRFTLLGFRYRVADAAGAPGKSRVSVGGAYEAADVWVPGAGDPAVAILRAVGADSLRAVVVEPEADAGAAVLLEERGALGSSWRVLGGRPLGADDTVVVRGRQAEYRLTAARVRGEARILDTRVPFPWLTTHRIKGRGAPGDEAGGSVVLPRVERGVLGELRDFHPSVFQRTYPLADVLAGADSTAVPGLPALGSFLYYRDGTLHLADLDSEVDVVGAGEPEPLTIWSREDGGRRLLVAGLAHRDYPEPDLTLPERYGLRPLRSFRISVNGGWLDVALGASEVRTLDRDALEELRLPGGRATDGSPLYQVRLTPGRDALARRSVVFDAAPGSFAVAGQAVFRLPEEPTEGGAGVLTPSGLARWETGRPLTLGTGDRALLARIDGLGTSAGFWLVHLAVFGLLAALFVARPMSGPVFALALTTAGLASLRLVLGLSALARPPFVQEAQQLGLWLLAFLPWAVVTAGEAGRPGPMKDPGEGPTLLGVWRRWLFHALYALALVGFAVVLFEGSRAKQGVLALVAVGVLAFRLTTMAGLRPWRGASARIRAVAARRPRLFHGWSLGLGLLLLRALLELAGWREQVTVGGTRVGVSVFYTPLSLAALAALLLLKWDDVRAAAVSASGRLPDAVARAVLEVAGFLLLAYLGVSAWVSDFGIALVLLPGVLVALSFLGVRWAVPGRTGRMTVGALALPLLLFVLLQAAPPLLRFAWGGDLQAADVRMGEWNRNELLLLERGDPGALRMIGQRRSEALAVMRETMRSYTRGNFAGKGFLRGRVSEEIGETATREHTVSALLASQFGFWGVAGLVLLLASLLPPVTGIVASGGGGEGGGGLADARGGRRAWVALWGGLALLVAVSFVLPSPYNALVVGLLVAAALAVALGPAFGGLRELWLGSGSDESDAEAGAGRERTRSFEGGGSGLGPAGVGPGRPSLRRLTALLALYTLAFAGLYMVLANYGFVFFTGKNVYLLGLDSVSDALEALLLLVPAAVALGGEVNPHGPTAGTELEATTAVWWHPSDSDAVGGP